jgi:hypothetical protein
MKQTITFKNQYGNKPMPSSLKLTYLPPDGYELTIEKKSALGWSFQAGNWFNLNYAGLRWWFSIPGLNVEK